jgi:2-pyrone-4,6-dicarboxylate lactonase
MTNVVGTNGDAPLCLAPDLNTLRPRTALPSRATDCHCHVYPADPRYRLVDARTYTPATASLGEYLRMCDTIGIGRTVHVNASVYGNDNTLTLDVIRELGKHRARGVAGISTETSEGELKHLHEGGIRGFRLSSHVQGYGGLEYLSKLVPRVARFGWHAQLHFNRVDELVALESELMKTPIPLVFDHLGGARGEDGVDSPGFQVLLRILSRRDDAWVKLSSWYRRSETGAPGFSDMKPLVQAIVEARPDRAVFGTNWPHPNLFPPTAMPNDGTLLDTLCEWIPQADVREQIFVHNPARLYGFDE